MNASVELFKLHTMAGFCLEPERDMLAGCHADYSMAGKVVFADAKIFIPERDKVLRFSMLLLSSSVKPSAP
ncbi:MAG: hypothetical protein ACFCUR_08990 [Rhodomicrobiaceae bacterium]